jgi:hypothetical protein
MNYASRMLDGNRVAIAAALALWASTAFAGSIDPGLWKITSQVTSNGVVAPARVSTKCLTPELTRDLATTFSPVPRTINSDCEPIQRSLVGGKLNWKLVCKGQLDMELTGEFIFDSPRHYSATMRTKSAMAGMSMANLVHTLDAEWVSECP